MIFLYHGGGASLTGILGPAMSDAEWAKVRRAVQRLLIARGHDKASEALERYPFELFAGTNYFQDGFAVLEASVELDQYVELDELRAAPGGEEIFRQIAAAISEVGPYTRFVTASLDTEERNIPVAPPSPKITSEAVERALADAEQLLQSRGASSALDRTHTALHGYLRVVCDHANIPIPQDASVTNLFRLIRQQHPVLANLGAHGDEMHRVLMAEATIVDALNTLRNVGSGAHPSEEVVGDPEAMLAINTVRTLFHYLDTKIQST